MSECIWEDCDQEAIYCEGHAREFVDQLGRLSAQPAEPSLQERLDRQWHRLAISAQPARVQVPREPTIAMIKAANACRTADQQWGFGAIWRAMYDASPINALPEKHETED